MSIEVDQSCVTHTDDLPKYFVWVRHRIAKKDEFFPQLWHTDLRNTDHFKYLNEGGEPRISDNPVPFFIELKREERGLSLRALACCYPYPPMKPDVI